MPAKPLSGRVSLPRMPYAVVLALFAALPWLPVNGFYLFLAQTYFYTCIAVIGLNLLLGLSGQMSLGQGGFYALGAYGSALAALKLGWPVPLAIVAGTLVAAIAGAVVGVFALRTRGLYLAMTTLAVGYIIDILAQRWVSVTGGAMGMTNVPQMDFGFPKMAPVVFFYFTGIALFLVQLVSDFIVQSRVGRNLRAIRESEVFAASVGVEVSRWKAGIFAYAAALAGLAGACFAHQSAYVGSDAFSVSLSVAFLIAAVVGGLGTRSGPLLGTAILMGIVEIIAGIDKYGLLIYGAVLLVVLLAFPKGAAGILAALVARLSRGPRGAAGAADATAPLPYVFGPAGTSALTQIHASRTSLTINGISKSYFGLKAVDRVSVDVRPGTVHGLIGPNGAGKSTIINMVAGVFAADEGTIFLGAQDISSMGIAARARLGLARTFQNLQLIEGVTVVDNVMLGIARKDSAFADFRRWITGGALEGAERREALAILEFLGLGRLADRLPAELPYGHRKLLELARAIAQRPHVLLLDEPIAGINSQEAREIAQVIGKLRGLGMTILLVEHNMEFVMSVCDEISVLNFGKLIARGTPGEIQQNPDVIEAYLGSGAKA